MQLLAPSRGSGRFGAHWPFLLMSDTPQQQEYEELVRQQLTELGYNSDAIPDAVHAAPFRMS